MQRFHWQFPTALLLSEPVLSIESGRLRTLGDDMLAARCLMLNSYLIDRYFSVHLMNGTASDQ